MAKSKLQAGRRSFPQGKIEKKHGKLSILAIDAQLYKDGLLFQPIRDYSLGEEAGFMALKREADKLQREFDEDCDPVRVYICEDGIPVYAALNAKENLCRIKNLSDITTNGAELRKQGRALPETEVAAKELLGV